MHILIVLALTFAVGLLAYWLSERKGRATRMWVLLSALFGFPVLILTALPAKNPEG